MEAVPSPLLPSFNVVECPDSDSEEVISPLSGSLDNIPSAVGNTLHVGYQRDRVCSLAAPSEVRAAMKKRKSAAQSMGRRLFSRQRSKEDMTSAIAQFSRLVASLSTTYLPGHVTPVNGPPELTQEDIFMQRFSPRALPKATSPFLLTGDLPSTDFANHTAKKSWTEQRWQKFARRPQILAPDDSWLFYWLAVMTIAALYTFWSLPPRIAYFYLDDHYWVTWLCTDLLVDLLFVSDILVQLRTGYLEQGIVVKDTRKLVKRYTASSAFIVDMLAVLPMDYVYYALYHGHPTHVVLRALKLLKLYRVAKFRSMIESRTTYPNAIRVGTLTHLLLLTCHWFACVHFCLAKRTSFVNSRWFGHMDDNDVHNATGTRIYLLSLYWATLTLTTIGNQSAPATNFEYVFTIASYLMGVFYFATIVGQVGNVIANRNASRLEYERLLDGAKQYMRYHRVPKPMRQRVQRWYDYSWSRGRMTGGTDIQSLSVLPDKLKTELALHVNLDTLKKVAMFKDCQPEFLHDLVLRMRAVIFTPGDIICRRGEIAREMYIIADGLLQVTDELGNTIREMHSGDFFGEIGVLNLSSGANRRTADVTSTGYSELFILSRDEVLAALKDYPQAEKIITQYGRNRLEYSTKRSGESTPANQLSSMVSRQSMPRPSVPNTAEINNVITPLPSQHENGNKQQQQQQQMPSSDQVGTKQKEREETTTIFTKKRPSKSICVTDPTLSGLRDKLLRWRESSTSSGQHHYPRAQDDDVTASIDNCQPQRRHMSVGSSQHQMRGVATPSPITNLLGCRVSPTDSKRPSTLVQEGTICDKHRPLIGVGDGYHLPPGINFELDLVTVRLQRLIPEQLRHQLIQEISIIRTLLEKSYIEQMQLCSEKDVLLEANNQLQDQLRRTRVLQKSNTLPTESDMSAGGRISRSSNDVDSLSLHL